MLAVDDYRHAIDEDMLDAHRVLMGFIKSSAVGDRGGVKDDDIGKHSRRDRATMIEPQQGSGQGC